MEVQVDAYITQSLSRKEKLSYLESLVKATKKLNQQGNSNLSLSFAINSSMLERRISTILKLKDNGYSKKTLLFYMGACVLSIALLIASILITFEAYNINPEKVEGTFTINHSTSYFIMTENKTYDLYVDGEYISNMINIPDELSSIQYEINERKCIMKRLFRTFAFLLMCSIVSGSMGMETYAYSFQNVNKTPSISPQANIIEWRYKVENGKLYKRQYDCTDNEWIGEWVLVI